MTDWWAVSINAAVAVGTLSAASAALWVARRDGRRLDEERREQHSAQARLVTCSVDFPNINITNHSPMPVLELSVRLMIVTGPDDRHGWVCMAKAPTQLRKPLPTGATWTVVAENECQRVGEGGQRETREVTSQDQIDPELRIVDANGLEWQRYGKTPPRLVPVFFGP
ncbi:hypothetical protein OG444_39950 (plasmid) [Streptomyces sp. NBC_01232]|uniref:hypothetical protein n=1 Tax=Streptomyces sp. NBC_01232 TaxID=2903786 RepID=UPI002E106D9B|nr:hypothetical protein OG444_39950 [Streptomyces sp. NBC_01232]